MSGFGILAEDVGVSQQTTESLKFSKFSNSNDVTSEFPVKDTSCHMTEPRKHFLCTFL